MLKTDPANRDKASAETPAGALVLVADDDAHIVELVGATSVPDDLRAVEAALVPADPAARQTPPA